MLAAVRHILSTTFLALLGIAALVLVVLTAALGLAGLSVGRHNVATGALLGLVALTGVTAVALCAPSVRR